MQAAILASLAASAVAAPLVSRRQETPAGVDDITILNYALTLEHLEATFYREALAQFSDEDFKQAGLGADFVNNLKQIASDEAAHVEFLTGAINTEGGVPVQECSYAFGYNDVQSFLATANLLEGVGVSAYLGAAQFIADKTYLTAAGSILTVEARHSAYIRDNQTPKPLSPFPFPYDIPLSFNNVFSLAAPLITSCPDAPEGTLGLPFTAYPSIAVGPAGAAQPGDVLTFTVSEQVEAQAAYFITFPGGPIEAVLATANGIDYQVTVPEAAQPGQAYVVFTSDGLAPTDENTVAGPAVFEILDNAGEFQKANPDYSYGKDCDKKYEQKPDGPKAPVYDAPKEDTPKSPEAPKAPEYSPKDDTPKSPEAPKAPEYAPKDDSPKSPEAPKAPVYDAPKKDEHKDVIYKPEQPKQDKPKQDDEPKKDVHAPIYDKNGNKYPLDKDGKVCVYDEKHVAYPVDKDGKPYGKDETTGKYYIVDAYGKKEPCVDGYTPY